jgi:NAD(P)-dependent dehydrogenase (short-subunit alcohol dehydrogenase family)
LNWSPDPQSLRGRVAVVAGATRGAGRGIAGSLRCRAPKAWLVRWPLQETRSEAWLVAVLAHEEPAASADVLQAAGAGTSWEDLRDDEPIAKDADRGQVLF